jgi:cephalosporin hydroxylase
VTDFERFKQERYNARPWDLPENPMGFPTEEIGVTSDISAHLPLLEFLARGCDHITEFGTRYAASTSALIAGCRGKVVSYDIRTNKEIRRLQKINKPCEWEFCIDNTLKLKSIEETDLLFVDTIHTYSQVKAELRFAPNVRKYIVFHDTYSQGEKSRDRPQEEGITRAIDEFLAANPQWRKVYEVKFNHGLTILEKGLL